MPSSASPRGRPMVLQFAAGDVTDGTATAFLVEPSVATQSLEVLRCGRAGDYSPASIVDISHPQTKQSLVKRSDESFGISLLTGQQLAEIVTGVRDLQPAPPLHGLEDVCLDAKLYPRRRITVWIEGRALRFLQGGVVLTRVSPQIWLDGNQFW